jgi:hypothetical protein
MKRQPTSKVHYSPASGYGLYAARDIKEGELIEKHEEKGAYIVTKSFV